jgi:Holliday junction resolvase RusA-like endonuclease
MIKLEGFPVPPSTNALYKNVGRRRAKTDEYKEYEFDCEVWYCSNIKAVKRAIKYLGDFPLLTIKLEYNLPKSKLFTKQAKVKKYDLSNRIKALEDQLFRLLERDDSCVFEIHATKYMSDLNNVNITISNYSEGV